MRVKYLFSSRRTRHTKNMTKQRKKYPAIVQKIIDDSDIVVQVLDSRFVEETRNKEIEEEIAKLNKKLIFVLNKSDLTNFQKLEADLKPKVIISCKERKGVKKLRDLIKKEAKKVEKPLDSLGKIMVGIIGYPNTGKSSLINILIGKNSAKTGSDAGFTKGLQKLRLTENITLLDSPGVIPHKEYSSVEKELLAKHTKISARSHSQIREPEMVIASIMREYPNLLEIHYKTSSESGNSEDFLEELGKRWNFFKKKGIVNDDKTGRKVLKDWQEGKIRID